jgi:ubiquinone/menaquinone biosynthesis C-methylase UbiE
VAQTPFAGPETRQSHGLDQFCASLEERPGMSILDFAGASQATVSFVTNYGHRLYSDDFVRQLDRVFGSVPVGANGAEFFDNQTNPALVSDFFELALGFDDSSFDGALVWDSLQFLSSPLLQTVVAKLHRMLRPGANLLALFHTEERIESIPTFAYRIQDHRTIQMVSRSQRKPAQIFNNRSLEKLFQDFHSVKFFLTRDRLREVIVRR